MFFLAFWRKSCILSGPIMCVSASEGRSWSTLWRVILSIFLCLQPLCAPAQSSPPINVQGRVVANGLVFNGTGKFKFALVLSTGQFLWTQDGTTTGVNFEP